MYLLKFQSTGHTFFRVSPSIGVLFVRYFCNLSDISFGKRKRESGPQQVKDILVYVLNILLTIILGSRDQFKVYFTSDDE